MSDSKPELPPPEAKTGDELTDALLDTRSWVALAAQNAEQARRKAQGLDTETLGAIVGRQAQRQLEDDTAAAAQRMEAAAQQAERAAQRAENAAKLAKQAATRAQQAPSRSLVYMAVGYASVAALVCMAGGGALALQLF